MSTRFDGKAALVTGGGSGIGEAIVRRLAAEGASVVVMDVQAEAAERVAGEIPSGSPFAGDVTDPEASERAVAHAVETFGGLHIAANIAGIGGPLISSEEYPIADWRKVIDVNLSGVYYSMRAELRHMLSAGAGSVVNMASMFSVVARDSMVAYVAAKHGVLGITRAAAIDCAGRGVASTASARPSSVRRCSPLRSTRPAPTTSPRLTRLGDWASPMRSHRS